MPEDASGILAPSRLGGYGECRPSRHVDEYMGFPATGTPIALPGITILHFRGDRCVERFSEADLLGLLIQIGAVPGLA